MSTFSTRGDPFLDQAMAEDDFDQEALKAVRSFSETLSYDFNSLDYNQRLPAVAASWQSEFHVVSLGKGVSHDLSTPSPHSWSNTRVETTIQNLQQLHNTINFDQDKMKLERNPYRAASPEGEMLDPMKGADGQMHLSPALHKKYGSSDKYKNVDIGSYLANVHDYIPSSPPSKKLKANAAGVAYSNPKVTLPPIQFGVRQHSQQGWGVSGKVHLTVQEVIQGNKGLPLLEPGATVKWEWTGTGDWASKGMEATWQDRRLGNPAIGVGASGTQSVTTPVRNNIPVPVLEGSMQRRGAISGPSGRPRGVGGVAGAVRQAALLKEAEEMHKRLKIAIREEKKLKKRKRNP